MCDTLVVTAEASRDGVTIFAKNSDREPNEAHHLAFIPAQDHPAGSMVRLTYVEIPQVPHTYAVLLAKPFNIWGAEMGVNEHGVAIGNEAVFTRIPYLKGPGITGMDLLRLGLERSRNALEALEVMTELLERYGQGGNCGFQHPFYYHNSFIIADPRQAWVLETADRHWAARQVHGIYTISNGITIGNEWDRSSPDLVTYAIERGWCRRRDDFDFARCYSDFLYTRFSACRYRCQRSRALLEAQHGQISVASAMAVLRDHGPNADADWRPDRGLSGAEICMHVAFGPIRVNQTVGSMVSHLHPEHPTHFFTGTAAPCTSLFKPVWLDAGLPQTGPIPQGTYDSESLFWQHERLHRLTVLDYPHRLALYRHERDALEAQLTEQALALAALPAEERRSFSEEAFAQARQAESAWLERVRQSPLVQPANWLYRRAWEAFNRQAAIPLH